VVELDPRRSRPRRRLELTACDGNTFAEDDGSLLVARQCGVMRHGTDTADVAAGGYARTPTIVLGIDGAPWLLDRSTTGWPGNQPGHLVVPGAHLGTDQRYSCQLPAASCANACWMRERTFLVLGDGRSCVVDVATGEFRWIVTPVGRPHGLVRLNETWVLVTGWDRHLQAALIDTESGWTSQPVAVNLAGHVGDAVMIGQEVFVVAGAPVSSAVVVPVVARLALGQLLAQMSVEGRLLLSRRHPGRAAGRPAPARRHHGRRAVAHSRRRHPRPRRPDHRRPGQRHPPVHPAPGHQGLRQPRPTRHPRRPVRPEPHRQPGIARRGNLRDRASRLHARRGGVAMTTTDTTTSVPEPATSTEQQVLAVAAFYDVMQIGCLAAQVREGRVDHQG
jgi:hypothetical protein